jgi:serine protein kinase
MREHRVTLTPMDVHEALRTVTQQVEAQYRRERRLLSYSEYLELFAADPARHARDASRYVRDVFEHYGRTTVTRPWGSLTRFRLFDLPWLEEPARGRLALVGQEQIQQELFRSLSNFAKEGRPNRLLLLHGPNGSAKSTVAACLMAALEHYSTLDEGALYRFHWIFPSRDTVKGAIGFSGRALATTQDGSFAHLPDDQIDARLFIELRDHPLFLLPAPQRAAFIERALGPGRGLDELGVWIREGQLSHKNRQIYDALFASYEGSLEGVLRHVQVERYFISRRYRTGAVTIGPQLSIDAGERQITADRSLGALPPALQGISLFEAFGELVDSSGGLLEFSDLLKRPLDAFKYLQLSIETGEVPLRSQTVTLNNVMIGSANEGQLAAFREHPEFESFRGRLELIRASYLLSWVDEQAIYDAQVVPQVRGHVAPHATRMAAMFAVLSRLRKPNPERFTGPLASVLGRLGVFEKLDLYGTGTAPDGFGRDEAGVLLAHVREIYEESVTYPVYEGSIGASPREMRGVLLDAAQDPRYGYLSPFAVLERLTALTQKASEYAWLEQDAQAGGYHDTSGFLEGLRKRLLDAIEDEVQRASGLVDERRYAELFERYVLHVNHWVKREKLQNPMTGALEDPDPKLMEDVETRLGPRGTPEERRHGIISRIAAWAIEHPGQRVDHAEVFPVELGKLRSAAFEERRVHVARICRDLVTLEREENPGMEEARVRAARAMQSALEAQFAYTKDSAADAAAVLLRERYASLLT